MSYIHTHIISFIHSWKYRHTIQREDTTASFTLFRECRAAWLYGESFFDDVKWKSNTKFNGCFNTFSFIISLPIRSRATMASLCTRCNYNYNARFQRRYPVLLVSTSFYSFVSAFVGMSLSLLYFLYKTRWALKKLVEFRDSWIKKKN